MEKHSGNDKEVFRKAVKRLIKEKQYQGILILVWYLGEVEGKDLKIVIVDDQMNPESSILSDNETIYLDSHKLQKDELIVPEALSKWVFHALGLQVMPEIQANPGETGKVLNSFWNMIVPERLIKWVCRMLGLQANPGENDFGTNFLNIMKRYYRCQNEDDLKKHYSEMWMKFGFAKINGTIYVNCLTPSQVKSCRALLDTTGTLGQVVLCKKNVGHLSSAIDAK